MDKIDKDIKEYNKMREDLEIRHMGKWVLIHDCNLIKVYDSFESAAEDAVAKFGKGPFLIRQVGAPPITLSASVMYNITHA